jgi:segregation and condensation protein B
MAQHELSDDANEEPLLEAGVEEDLSLQKLTDAFAQLLSVEEDEGEVEVANGEGAVDESVDGATEEVASESPVAEAKPAPQGEPEPPPEDETPVTPRSILEAMLFVDNSMNHPLSARQAASLLRGVSPHEVAGLVDELNEIYDEAGTPYKITSESDGFRLTVRSKYRRLADNFHGRIRDARLSQAAIDVLALVAYQQPATKDQIDEIRGKPSGGLLNQLVRRQLLRVEHVDGKPRKKKFHTTDRFLDLFGLESVEDLPQVQ